MSSLRCSGWKRNGHCIHRESLTGRPAADGIQGMKQFAKQHPDLMVTDIFMPEKEGLSTIMDAKKADPSVKILAMSGGGRVWNMDALPVALSLGADAVLHKPFRREEFLGLVSQLLAPSVR
jgi:DNA-binding response OmpR family regulator